eukprot:6176012-Pleurochrysis_carterae.AAC.1
MRRRQLRLCRRAQRVQRSHVAEQQQHAALALPARGTGAAGVAGRTTWTPAPPRAAPTRRTKGRFRYMVMKFGFAVSSGS